ncbi:MAG: hypothetical protein V3U35_01080, partial [Candidatus Neomarinimicrobiota bacterium]
RGLGLNLGFSQGLTPETYPAVLRSREVQLAVARERYFISGQDSTTFVEYVSRQAGTLVAILEAVSDYTIGLPGKVMRLFKAGSAPAGIPVGSSRYFFLTEEEDDALRVLADITGVAIDAKTSIITISATTPDPMLSAQLVTSLIYHLTRRVQEMHTRKTSETLAFVRQQFAAAQAGLEAAEVALAQFLDQNRDPQTARLRTEMERLQRQMRFKGELYNGGLHFRKSRN